MGCKLESCEAGLLEKYNSRDKNWAAADGCLMDNGLTQEMMGE